MPRLTRWTLPIATCAVAACSSAMRPSSDASAPSSAELAGARAAIDPQFREMFAAANAHDTDRHLASYQRSPALTFVANDQVIHGWDALRVQQLKWWNNGKSDAVYEVRGTPEYAMPSANVVVQTYLLDSHRGAVTDSAHAAHLAVTDVWRRLPEGWRIVYAHESIVLPR